MQDCATTPGPNPQPDPDSIRRLLNALGDWGAAEVRGVSGAELQLFADRAMSAYTDLKAAV